MTKIKFCTCQILPVERETVHHKGAGEPVEIHDQSFLSEYRKSEDIHYSSIPVYRKTSSIFF